MKPIQWKILVATITEIAITLTCFFITWPVHDAMCMGTHELNDYGNQNCGVGNIFFVVWLIATAGLMLFVFCKPSSIQNN